MLTEGALRMCTNRDGRGGFAGRGIMQEIHIVKGSTYLQYTHERADAV